MTTSDSEKGEAFKSQSGIDMQEVIMHLTSSKNQVDKRLSSLFLKQRDGRGQNKDQDSRSNNIGPTRNKQMIQKRESTEEQEVQEVSYEDQNL